MTGAELIEKYKNGMRQFRYADLRGANLRRANLSDADLRYANLRYANLRAANLSDADLSDADLRGADLRYADLRYANLRRANLSDANLSDANLPAPPVVLLAYWGEVSRPLCRELMRYDAANHPRANAFLRWAVKDGPCPYDDVKVERAANFTERQKWYVPGESKSAFWLMRRVLREKCKDSDYHTKKDRERWTS